MVSERQGRAEKLEAEFTRLGMPGGDYGDARDRARLLGVKSGTLRSWLSGDRPTPDYPFALLKAFELMPADARETYRAWVRECARRGDYAPAD